MHFIHIIRQSTLNGLSNTNTYTKSWQILKLPGKFKQEHEPQSNYDDYRYELINWLQLTREIAKNKLSVKWNR